MASKKSEIRQHYFLKKYVIITPGRAKRPRDVKEQTVIKRTAKCPFCPENIDKKTIVDKVESGNSGGSVLAVKNIFPAVSLNNPKAFGAQEVIIETSKHTQELANLSEAEISRVIKMYIQRTKELSKNKKLDYILCFKNQGSKAGASIIHAHSQVFASNLIPPDLKEEALALKKYKAKSGRCAYCDIIKKETKSKRKIYSDKYIAAFAPYASQYHYEAWIFPRRHLDNITLLNKDEQKSLVKSLKIILKKMQALDLSFNLFLHNVISDKNQHFYIKVQPRDSVWAGVELGSGLVINSVPPEEAARYYKS
ncbi:hypothetical protein COV49_01815 [Candidatus Falkowbacteria bacterium CG11_big_fil_rev_8_21_14_0_20_39_10]|uniref:Galactose-1-phosphate uridyl transferase N-terminal domain-containing protein n=1 Tax=Candidatus Falkowbacteria bacterium CG11_big_fil_rev_8_21_14_0_20_39_10 TaxID=1974570 RepID=A0A2M6K979_9BACT|nr:MAG: hypothetical protein COV49_01815 [Candidatus Falkowbacteria bacterium CG11_big_fil_rev_8_21_14_0_20_39_10]